MEIVFTHKILGPPKLGALGLSRFSLMVNPRLIGATITIGVLIWYLHVLDEQEHVQSKPSRDFALTQWFLTWALPPPMGRC